MFKGSVRVLAFCDKYMILRRLTLCSKPVENVKPLKAVAVKDFQALGANEHICMAANVPAFRTHKSLILPALVM